MGYSQLYMFDDEGHLIPLNREIQTWTLNDRYEELRELWRKTHWRIGIMREIEEKQIPRREWTSEQIKAVGHVRNGHPTPIDWWVDALVVIGDLQEEFWGDPWTPVHHHPTSTTWEAIGKHADLILVSVGLQGEAFFPSIVTAARVIRKWQPGTTRKPWELRESYEFPDEGEED